MRITAGLKLFTILALTQITIGQVASAETKPSRVKCPRFIADRASGIIEAGGTKKCFESLTKAQKEGFVTFSDLNSIEKLGVILRDSGVAGVKMTRPTQLDGDYLVRYAFNDNSDTPGKVFRVSIFNVVTNEKVAEAISTTTPGNGASVVAISGTNLAFQVESSGSYSLLVQEKKN